MATLHPPWLQKRKQRTDPYMSISIKFSQGFWWDLGFMYLVKVAEVNATRPAVEISAKHRAGLLELLPFLGRAHPVHEFFFCDSRRRPGHLCGESVGAATSPNHQGGNRPGGPLKSALKRLPLISHPILPVQVVHIKSGTCIDTGPFICSFRLA